MNLTISSTNPSFGCTSEIRKITKYVASRVNRARCYAEIRASKDFNPAEYSKKNLLNKNIKRILGKYDKFTVKDFRALSPLKYSALKLQISTKHEEEAKLMSDMVEMAEKWLDDKYGKDNWVFVSIGRSLEPFADALKYKGHDARIMPISGLHHNPMTASEIASQKDFKIYQKYLKKIGISKNAIADDTRHYIFSDFCDTGRTIQTVRHLLSENLDINSDNVELKNFVTLYEEAYKTSKKTKLTTPDWLETMLRICTFKKFCKTGKVYCDEIGSVAKFLNSPQSFESKIFHFKLMDKYLPKKLDYKA